MHPGVLIVTALFALLVGLTLAWGGKFSPGALRTPHLLGLVLLGLAVIGLVLRFPALIPVVGIPALLWVLSRVTRNARSTGPRTAGQASPTGSSQVRTDWLSMSVDLRSGRMDGEVLRGEFQGSGLDDLNQPELHRLLDECAANDPQGARVLSAYLDQRFPNWRDTHTEHGQSDGGSTGPMTAGEAAAILGIRADATAHEVVEAHRRLMQRVHPDRGGSDYLAAQINQAKATLLGDAE